MPTVAPSANTFLNPARIVAGFGLRAGDHAADFGAGHGFFTLALAQAVGREGKVWAVDIQKSALDMVRARAMAEHTLNIRYVLADLEVPGGNFLPEKHMDFVLMGNILFQAEARGQMLGEAWACLRPGGRLALIDWDGASDTVIGPPLTLRIKKQDAKSLALGAGFELDREFAAGPHHYGLLFIKK